MPHTARVVALGLLLAVTGTVLVAAGHTDEPSLPAPVHRAQPTVRVGEDPVPASSTQQALVEWAADRFAQAGLELPDLTVRFDPSRELCGHHEGRYRHDPSGARIVTICTPDHQTFAAQLLTRRTLLHELGHAWEFANLTGDDRDALAVILGVDAWNDPVDEWEDRGVERFAETFVFALLDQPRRQLKVSLECPVLLRAFGTATGTEPLGPGLPSCAA